MLQVLAFIYNLSNSYKQNLFRGNLKDVNIKFMTK